MNIFPLVAVGVSTLNTNDDLLDVRYHLILNEDHCMAAIGSLENLPDYDEIRGKSF